MDLGRKAEEAGETQPTTASLEDGGEGSEPRNVDSFWKQRAAFTDKERASLVLQQQGNELCQGLK